MGVRFNAHQRGIVEGCLVGKLNQVYPAHQWQHVQVDLRQHLLFFFGSELDDRAAGHLQRWVNILVFCNDLSGLLVLSMLLANARRLVFAHDLWLYLNEVQL